MLIAIFKKIDTDTRPSAHLLLNGYLRQQVLRMIQVDDDGF